MLKITALSILVALLSIQLAVSSDNVENIQGFKIFNDKPHDLHLGKRANGDRFLHKIEIKKDRHLLRWAKADYTFPSDDDEDTYKITLVTVTNLQSKSEGGYPTLKSGGPGSDHVSLHFLSRWNKGLDFEVKVYGKKHESNEEEL